MPKPQNDPDVDEEDEVQDRPLNDSNKDEQGNAVGALGHQRIETPEPNTEGNAPVLNPSHIEHLHFAQAFINEVSRTTLDNGRLDDLTINNLRYPDEAPVNISDLDTHLSLNIFLSCKNTSEQTCTDVRDSILMCYPDSGILSYHNIKNLVAKITGVCAMPLLSTTICASMVAMLSQVHLLTYSHAMSAQSHTTILTSLPPQAKRFPSSKLVQFLLAHNYRLFINLCRGAHTIHYHHRKIMEIIEAFNTENPDEFVHDDIFFGEHILDLCKTFTEDDMTVVYSIDGAQLYQNKKSDTWIAFWIVMDIDPKTQYKNKCFIAALIIPGPNKPKNIDSYTFQSFHHLSALQHENDSTGLPVWDVEKECVVPSMIGLIGGLADAVGLTELDVLVGHHGAQGCQIGCEMMGMHKPNTGHYYAVHLTLVNANGPM